MEFSFLTLTGELAGYTFSRNAATGIEIMIPNGMKGKMAHILFQSKADVEAYKKLVETYKAKYPNLVQSPFIPHGIFCLCLPSPALAFLLS